jgi:gamma-glutamyltranspeptidase/glutathione hydrolase
MTATGRPAEAGRGPRRARGVVVCPQPLAAEIGAGILAGGGNAFDAAIATAVAQMLTDPHMCGLGGFGAATYLAAGAAPAHLAFHARVGSRATPDMWAADCRGALDLGGYTLFDDHRSNLGHRSVGTPGVVAGLAALHRHARLPWATLLRPAAALARRGFPAPSYVFDMLGRASAPGLPSPIERMTRTPDSARLWCRDDGRTLKQPGDHWANPDMADTLDRLAAAGAEDFYRGDLARAIAREIEAGGGYLTAEDLARYEARLVRPVAGRFRGLSVHSSTPPGGGITLLQMLHILDRFPPTAPGEPETYVLMAQAMREAFAERKRTLGDPDFVPIPAEALLGAEWADAAAERIRAGVAAPLVPAAAGGGTTHVSACDTDGNAVALTHTLGLYSGVVVPGTGIALNSAMDNADPVPGRPNSIAPGKARLSAMAPTIVLDDGRLRLVNGSPGTNAIATSVFQVIVGVTDHGLAPAEAVAAPRVHSEGGPVFVEGRIAQAARSALQASGFEVRSLPGNYVASLGRNQLIVIEADGRFTGASDPRRDGGVAAYA